MKRKKGKEKEKKKKKKEKKRWEKYIKGYLVEKQKVDVFSKLKVIKFF